MALPIRLNFATRSSFSKTSWLDESIILRDKLLFTADDGLFGRELWSTDGTADGTRLLKDINQGANSSFAGDFTHVGSRIFFSALNENGFELWSSDGTSTGTAMVKDIAPGREYLSFPRSSNPFSLTTFSGRLFFSADDGSSGRELWTSDGTAEGTFFVKDIFPGRTSSNFFSRPNNSDPYELSVVGNNLLFWAQDSVNGRELWRVDTSLKASLVKDINPGSLSARQSGLFSYSMKTPLGERLFFDATDGRTGEELWISDGTATGTRLLKEITPGSAGTFLADPTMLGEKLFFLAKGTELWSSDGTADGTRLVKQLNPGSLVGTASFNYKISAVAGGKLFLDATNSSGGHQLWASNGTSAGTQLLKVINPGITSAIGSGRNTYVVKQVVGNKLYFIANDGRSGVELWVSDGTAAGTALVKDILPGSQGSAPDGLRAVGNRIYFRANDGIHGRELWSSDGTAAGTRLEADLNPGPDSSITQNTESGEFDYSIKPFGDKLIFSGSDGLSGNELWALDLVGTTSTLSVAPLSASKAEGNSGVTPFTFRISRTGNTDGVSTVLWKVEGLGSNAANQSDFVNGSFPSGSVSFTPGEISRTITVNVVSDTTKEANENFNVKLLAPSTGSTLLNTTATATIINDDTLTQTLSSFNFGNINKSVSVGSLLGIRNEFAFNKFIGIDKSLKFSVTPFDFKSKLVDAKMSLSTASRDRIKAGFNLSAGASLGNLEINGGIGGKVLYNPSSNGGGLSFDIQLTPPSVKTTLPYAYAKVEPLLNLNLNPKVGYTVDPLDIPEVRVKIPKKIIVPRKCISTPFGKKCSPEISTPAVDKVVSPRIKLGPYSTSAAPFPSINVNQKFAPLLNLDTRSRPSSSPNTSTSFQKDIGGAQLSARLPSLADLSFRGTSNSSIGNWTGSVAGKSTLVDLNYDLLTLLPFPLSIKGDLPVEGFGRIYGDLYALKGLIGAKLDLGYSGKLQLKPILNIAYEGLAGSIDLDTSAALRGINFKDKPFKDLNKDGKISGSVTLDYTFEASFKASVSPKFNVNAKGIGGKGGFSVKIPGIVDSAKEFNFGPFLNLGTSLPLTSISLIDKSRKVKLSSLVNAIAPKQSFSFPVPAFEGSASAGFVNPATRVIQSSANRSIRVARSGSTTNSQFNIHVTNTDSALAIVPALITKGEGRSGTTPFSFTVSRSGVLNGISKADWRVVGTGDNPSDAADFQGATSGTVTFGPGETTRTLTVNVRGDMLPESAETFTLTLTNATGASLTTRAAIGTIINDDLIGNGEPDTLLGTRQAEFLDGGANVDTLTGGGAADVFGFCFGESPLNAPDLITDFAIGIDKISLFSRSGGLHPTLASFSRAANNANASTLAALAEAVFTDVNGARSGNQDLAANSAVLVRATNAAIAGTYLLINNGVAGRSDGEDLLIRLNGLTGKLPSLGAIALGTMFV